MLLRVGVSVGECRAPLLAGTHFALHAFELYLDPVLSESSN
jgi:hypothetical protein